MMSSILLNPQLIIYSTALDGKLLAVRIISCFVCGIVAGLLVHVFYCRKSHHTKQNNAVVELVETTEERTSVGEEIPKQVRDDSGRVRNDSYFDFSSFDEPHNHDTDPNIFLRLLKNIGRNIKATGPMFLLGVFLSALFQRYVPADAMAKLFGKEHEGFGLLMSATIGVPLYVCGGGTIPLILQWLSNGMSYGSVAAFMITGPATKITNLGALKIALGIKNFVIYIAFVILFSLLTGFIVNLIF